MFDTHVNLHSESFIEDLEEVLERARSVGVRQFISICDRLDKFEQVFDIVSKYEDIYCSVGVHPHHSKDYSNLALNDLVELTKSSKVVAVGETGLDFHRNYSSEDDQVRCFKLHIEAAKQTNLPIIVHTRLADALTAQILEDEYRKGAFSILLHCYTSGRDLLERGLKIGAYVSASGILSFKNAENVREIIKLVPLERLLIETDAPYLAPVPMRGRRNEPAYLPFVADAVAKLFEMDVDAVKAITTQNANKFFGIKL